LERAALRAGAVGANTFQIFSTSPRMWRSRAPDPVQIRLLKAARERFDLRPLSVHASYLVNLASADPLVRAKSIEAFRGEMERSEAIGAEYLVVHPGNCRGRSVEEGVAAFVLGLRDAAAGLRLRHLTVLLENTAGSGAHMGSKFEELQSIRDLARDLTDLPVAYCLDTCHLLASGFDVSTAAGLRKTMAAVEATLGLGNVHLLHANDSRSPLGSRVDRHAGIGQGHIGIEGFRRILSQPGLRRKPFILETPVKEPDDDRRNLDILKSLAASARTTAPRAYR
jgi:deoxyribonuclease IV